MWLRGAAFAYALKSKSWCVLEWVGVCEMVGVYGCVCSCVLLCIGVCWRVCVSVCELERKREMQKMSKMFVA